MADRVSGGDSGGQAWCWICGTTGMDMAAEEMRDGNIRYVGRRRWRNGLEEQQRTGKILTGNDYQPAGSSLLQ